MKIIKNLFILLTLGAPFAGAQAQDMPVEKVAVCAELAAPDTVALHNMLMNEAYVMPAMELYPNWDNSRVHFESKMPDSLLIDLTGYAMPTKNTKITDVFGYRPRRRREHKGLDVKVQRGDTIYAAFDGKVRIASYQRRGYGHYIVIRHNNGIETLYAHLSKKLVSANANVKAGQPIGLGGNTGRSTGSHLHFETLLLGKSIDPALMFDFENQRMTGDSFVYRKSEDKSLSPRAPKYHRVRKGETIAKIARKYGVPQRTILKLNGLKASSIIRPGQRLRYQ